LPPKIAPKERERSQFREAKRVTERRTYAIQNKLLLQVPFFFFFSAKMPPRRPTFVFGR
jgi:hypothetical protein